MIMAIAKKAGLLEQASSYLSEETPLQDNGTAPNNDKIADQQPPADS